MIDIKLIRKNPEFIKDRLLLRNNYSWKSIDEIVKCDELRRSLETKKQNLQERINIISKEIAFLKKENKDNDSKKLESINIGKEIKIISDEIRLLKDKQLNLLYQTPNLPHENCPLGKDPSNNVEIKIEGTKPQFNFKIKDHIDIGKNLNLFNFDLSSKISSSGFVVFNGIGAKLERSLIQFLLDTHVNEHNYNEISTPFIVNRNSMMGTGQLPKFETDMYEIENGKMFLTPTAEVPITNLYRDTFTNSSEFPIKLTGYTPCFRREAGASGKDNRGLTRMHQFDKVELVNIVHPDDSISTLEKLTIEAENILKKLNLHYRVIELCSGDLGFSAEKTYDIEVWSPGQNTYLEVSSCSCFGDYQTRRMNIKFKDKDGKNKFCHTLNASGVALPRLYIALIESNQLEDGSINIPEVLRPYMNMNKITFN